jgi:hypothetical protein
VAPQCRHPEKQSPQPIEMIFAKDDAAKGGFNRWTMNGVAFSTTGEIAPASFHLKKGKRYRIRMRNALTISTNPVSIAIVSS